MTAAEAALRDAVRRTAGEQAASTFERALTQGLPCELCGNGGATLRYPEAVALCERCEGKGQTATA